MESGNVEKLTRTIMADSKLEIADPLFSDVVMKLVLLEHKRQKNRKQALINILVFIGVEFIVLFLIWILLVYYPGYSYFVRVMNNIMPLIKETGYFVMRNGYLIISLTVACITHWILNLRSDRAYSGSR